MLNYRLIIDSEKKWAFQLMLDSAADYIEVSLKLMNISIDQFYDLFVTRGSIYIVSTSEEDIGFFWIEQSQDTLNIHGLVLALSARGKGYGKKIMEYIEKHCGNNPLFFELGVKKENTVAIHLYQSLNYEISGDYDDIGYYIMKKKNIELDSYEEGEK